MAAQRLYTDEERKERTRARKRLFDRKRSAQKTINARARYQRNIAMGLTSKGTERVVRVAKPKAVAVPKHRPVRAIPDGVAKQAAPSIRAETVAEYMANGGRVDVLPGFRYVPSRVMPVGARY